MNFYIATGFARQKDHNKVRDALHAHRHRGNPDDQHLFITYDWTQPENQISGQNQKIAKEEIDGVARAHFVVVLLPGKFGTHAELGAALARNVKVFLSGPKDAACIFYDHPLVTDVGDSDPVPTVLAWVEEEYSRARSNEP